MSDRAGSAITRRALLRRAGAFGATAAGLAILGACQQPGTVAGPSPAGGASAAPASPRRGGILAVAVPGDPGEIRPFSGTSSFHVHFQGMVFDGLYAYDPVAKELKPGLAESWETAADGKSHTFKLRRGVKFHDGTEFTAESVTLNFDRVRDPNSRYYDKVAGPISNSLIGSAERVEVVDPNTVRYVMKQPNGDFPILNTWGFQLSPAVIKQYPAAEVGRYPVGTGPFRLADRQEGRAAFERFDGYWNGAPYLDKVVFRFYPDNATASAALESGDVDVMTGAPIEVVSRLGDRFKRMPWSSHFTAFAALNLRHPFTKDVRVRQALNYAVDREKLAKELYKGLVTVARGIASPTFPSWNSSLEPYPFDPERAKKLLADAGFGSGTTVRALLPTTAGAFPLLLELAQSVQADLRKVGVTVNHDVLEPNALTREIAKGLSADHVYHWGSLGGATPSNLELLFGKRFQPPNGINRGWYENEQVEKLFDQARGELDLAKRNRLYQQADEILKTDAAALFTIIYPTYALHAPKVVGLADRFFFMDFSKAWLSQ